MSSIYQRTRYDQHFQPRPLCNWQIPAYRNRAGPEKKNYTGSTKFITDEKGHLLPGTPKTHQKSAFVFDPPETNPAPPRWPTYGPLINTGPASTLGYKGITTHYLPQGTVTLKTQCHRTNTQ